MLNLSHSEEHGGLFPELTTTTPEKEMFEWEIEIGDDTYTVKGATKREAFAEVGRALGSLGQPETCYRHLLQRKPVVVSKISVKFLEQK
jgi:hypothetical protein